MIRGMIKFKCDDCGEVFEGLDAEWRATSLTAPVKCKCGSCHTYPYKMGAGVLNKVLYRKIWAELDKQN